MRLIAVAAASLMLLAGCGQSPVMHPQMQTQPSGIAAQGKLKQGLFGGKVLDRKFVSVAEMDYAVSGVKRITIVYNQTVKKLIGGTKEEKVELWLDYLSGDQLTNVYMNHGARLANNDDTYAIAEWVAKAASELPEGADKKVMTHAAAGMLTYR